MGRVLVLDTNLLWGASRGLLEALAGRGHVLTLSVIALEERLARATRDGVEPLRVRLRNVAPFIDAENPIAPQGGPLYARLGIDDPDPSRRFANDSYNRVLPSIWRNLVGREALQDWEGLASAMKGSIDEAAEFVRQQAALLRGVPRDGVTYEKVYTATQKLCSEHPVVVRFGVSRLDAYISRLARMIFNSKQEPSKNDVEDLALLEHLVEDVILLTDDKKSIAAIDATASLQAPFVRSPWEVLDGAVPAGPPWGPSAMAALTAWRADPPRTGESLSQVEQKVRRQIGLATKDDANDRP